MKTYSQFISEARDPRSDYLQTLSRNIERSRGVKVQASHTPSGSIRVHGIHVKPENQGQGRGSDAVRLLQKAAERQGKGIRLSASATPGRERDLHRFYVKHGFKRPDRSSDTYHWNPK